MKFRNMKTGEIYSGILTAMAFHCDNVECDDCKIRTPVQAYRGMNDPCRMFCVEHPSEAAQLMGYYEVIEEEPKADRGNPTRESILEEAKRCVCGQREQDHGKAEDNFKLIASLWEPYIRQRCVSEGADVSIEPEDVAMLMSLLKIARICTGTGTRDSFVDLAGYAACGGEIAGGAE